MRELSARFGPTPTTIYKWLQAMSGDVVELKRLQAELAELKMKNAFLKRAAAWFATFKCELLHRLSKKSSLAQLQASIIEFVKAWYNRRRLHSS